VSQCKSCNAELVWGITAKGHRMPFDAKSDPKGEWVLDDEGQCRKVDLFEDGVRYTSHFATCPDADQHRRRGHG